MEITQEVIDAFRLAYPMFPIAQWSDNTVRQSLCEGDAETGGAGWGIYENECHNFKQRGMFLYAAHWLASTYPNGDIPSGGSASGGAKWATSGKSVGDESVSFNTGSLANMPVGDSWIASTAFGQQWLRLRRRSSMGALAV
ncbi:MAG: DUF4054 domain-containing protein [candidate division Zixibacteria bacterium]|nr:DUF4054 domain-containing protein [candidate division Zixibacteria bacterium]